MQGDVEHGGVVVECLLGAIAVVNVLVGRGGSIREEAQGLTQRSKFCLAHPDPVVDSGGAAHH